MINAAPRDGEAEETWKKACEELDDLLYVFRDGYGNEKKPSEYYQMQKPNEENDEENDPNVFHYVERYESLTVEKGGRSHQKGCSNRFLQILSVELQMISEVCGCTLPDQRKTWFESKPRSFS